MKRSLIATIAIALIAVLGAAYNAYSTLSSILPEQLVGAQIFRPEVDGSPTKLPFPTWFVDVHWRFSGERIVERTNRNSSTIVKYMLGVEMRKDEVGLPIDRALFRELMRQYVCENASEIPSPAQISKHTRLDSVPDYVDALRLCGRLEVKN